MRANYQKALGAVLVHEGGYVNHPRDPGGATMKGITQAVYDAYRRKSGVGPQSVAKIDDYELQAIYKRQYWDVIHGDDLPSGVDYCVFDFAVNSGTSRAAKYLQAAIGVRQDGVIGLATLDRANDADRISVIVAICKARMAFLRGLKTWDTFGRGWKSRVEGVEALARKMVSQAPETPAQAVEPAPAPQTPAKPKIPVKEAAGAAAGGAVVAAGTGMDWKIILAVALGLAIAVTAIVIIKRRSSL